MKVSNKSNDGALLTSSKKKSSVDGILKDASNRMVNLTQARDDMDVMNEEIEISEERHKSLVNANKDVTTENWSFKQSKSLKVHQKKAPAALYRSRTAVQQDKKSSPVSEDMVTPASLSRSRTATPQISTKRSSPTFSDMMKLVALSQAKSIKLNTLPQPEEIEEVATKEEEDEASSPQISGEVKTSSGANDAADEEVPAADFAPAAKDPAVEDPTVVAPAAKEDAADEVFATVALVEEVDHVEVEFKQKEVEVELEPEEEFAQVVEVPSAVEDSSSKSTSSKKSKWSKKMRGFLAKK